MDIINQLSSKQNDRSSFSNKEVARLCIENTHLINEIAQLLDSPDQGLQTDSAEVFSIISETNPILVSCYGDKIVNQFFISSKKARWELAHCLSLVATQIPTLIQNNLDKFEQAILEDKSVIVRDYLTDTIANFAVSSSEAAKKSLKILLKIENAWEEKHAKQVLKGLQNVCKLIPDKHSTIISIATKYLNAKKTVTQKEAKKLAKLLS